MAVRRFRAVLAVRNDVAVRYIYDKYTVLAHRPLSHQFDVVESPDTLFIALDENDLKGFALSEFEEAQEISPRFRAVAEASIR